MKSDFRRQFASAGWVAVLMISGAAVAQTFPKEGSYDYTACWSGASNLIAFSKSHSAFTFEMTGSTRSNPPGSLFDKESFRCIGTNTSFDGKTTGLAICEAIDKDGHKRLTHFSTGSDGKTVAEVISGTGKFEGIVMTRTVTPLGPFPVVKAGTFQNCNHQKGTYKMK